MQRGKRRFLKCLEDYPDYRGYKRWIGFLIRRGWQSGKKVLPPEYNLKRKVLS